MRHDESLYIALSTTKQNKRFIGDG